MTASFVVTMCLVFFTLLVAEVIGLEHAVEITEACNRVHFASTHCSRAVLVVDNVNVYGCE